MNLEEKTKAEELKEEINILVRRIPFISELELEEADKLLLIKKSVEYKKLTGEYYNYWREEIK